MRMTTTELIGPVKETATRSVEGQTRKLREGSIQQAKQQYTPYLQLNIDPALEPSIRVVTSSQND
jgi:hypothetical protein